MPDIDFQPIESEIDFQIDFQPEPEAPQQPKAKAGAFDADPMTGRMTSTMTLSEAGAEAPSFLKDWATTVGPEVVAAPLLGLASMGVRAAAGPAYRAVKASPQILTRTIDTGIGAARHSPIATVQGIRGHGPTTTALKGIQGLMGKAKAAPKTTPQQALKNEISSRIDWRTTDAVPIDAIKRDMSRGGSIIRAGESVPGLADELARILKSRTPEALKEADEVARALRQRQHITAKSH
jgi:hypothetical protein